MSRLATMTLQGGQLQLFVCQDYQPPALPTDPQPQTLLSYIQGSGSNLAAFDPYPDPYAFIAVAAGNFSDGSAQLWAQGFTPDGTSALLTIIWDSANGWGQWQGFLDQPQMGDPLVAPTANGGLQIWCTDQRGAWTSSSQTNSAGGVWSEWTPFPMPSGQTRQPLVGVSLAASRFPGPNLAQLWASVENPVAGKGIVEEFSSIWQTTSDPTAAWSAWQMPFQVSSGPLPGGSQPAIAAAGAIQRSNYVQLVLLVSGKLYTTKSTAPGPGGPWVEWTQIPTGGFYVVDMTLYEPYSATPTYGVPAQLWAIVLDAPFPEQIMVAQQQEYTTSFAPFQASGLTWPT
jgi:hypothetical protein